METSLPHLYPDLDADTQVDPINPDATVIQRLPRCTIVGMPPPMHLPAKPAVSNAFVASYVSRYPPVEDDVIVVDMDFDPVRRRAEILTVTQRIEIRR